MCDLGSGGGPPAVVPVVDLRPSALAALRPASMPVLDLDIGRVGRPFSGCIADDDAAEPPRRFPLEADVWAALFLDVHWSPPDLTGRA